MLEAQAQKEVEQRAKDLLRVEWVTEPGHLGQGCAQPNLPKFKKAREDLMERLRLRAKPLPPHMEAHDGAPASARDADVGSENEENEPNEPEEVLTEMWGNKGDEEEEAAAECEGGRAFEKTVCPSCNQPVWPDSPLPEPVDDGPATPR